MSVIATGCSTCSSESGAAPEASTDAAVFVPGESVVVEYARATFFEGTVAVTGAEKLTVAEKSTGKTREVDTANVYRLDNAPAATWKPGDLAVCKMEPSVWRACRVAAVSAEVSVTDEKGVEAHLPVVALLVPTALTRVNLEHVFEQIDKVKAFARSAREAGEPHRPVAFEPRTGDNVIIRTGGAYVSAVVHESRRDLILVVSAPGEKPRAVVPEDVWPQPPVDATIAVGGFACLRPPAGDNVWKVVRVEAVKEGKFDVTTATGEPLTVIEKDLLPIQRAPRDG